MRIIKFTIHGNESEPDGNPRPKIKKTKRQQWTPQAQRYVAWKKHVVDSMKKQADKTMRQKMVNNIALYGKPIALSGKGKKAEAVMEINIYWKNQAHPDAENVFGSIADSIFTQDKKLDGAFVAQTAEDQKGKVDVTILIYGKNNLEEVA